MIVVYLWYLQAVSGFTINVLYSTRSPSNIVQTLDTKLNQSLNNFEINLALIRETDDIQNLIILPGIVIDVAYSLTLHEKIVQTANELNFIILNPIKRQNESYSNWEYFTHLSFEDHFKVIASIISFFRWQSFLVFAESPNDPLLQLIQSSFFLRDQVKVIYFENTQMVDFVVLREVKPIGNRNIIILTDGEKAAAIVKSMKKAYMWSQGTGVFLSDNGIWGSFEDGVMGTTVKGIDIPKSEDEYNVFPIIKMINSILECENYDNSMDLKDCLDRKTINHRFHPEFSIINFRNSQPIMVGAIIDGVLNITNEIIYPGNTIVLPSHYTNIIPVSIGFGTSNPYPNPIDAFNQYIKLGSLFAVGFINSQQSLGNFIIYPYMTDCGSSYYDYNFTTSCLRQAILNLGIVHLTPIWDVLCFGTIESFDSLEVKIPMISDTCGMTSLGDKEKYPRFMRVQKESPFLSTLMVNLLNIIGFREVAIIYTDDPSMTDLYESFLKESKRLNIKIMNQRRQISQGFNRDQADQYKDLFEEIIETRARILVCFLSGLPLLYSMQVFYDLGVRRGDIVFITNFSTAPISLYESDPDQLNKIIHLNHGAFGVVQGPWIGEYGQYIKQLYEAQYGAGLFQGFSFDAMMMAARAVQFCLQRGFNYEDPEVFNNILRIQRFTGATGTVSIGSGSNNRNIGEIYIWNIIYEDGVPIERFIGSYDAGRLQPIFLEKSIIWSDDSNNIPSSLRPKFDCPFDKKLIKSSEKARWIQYAFYSIIFVINLLAVIYMIRHQTTDDFVTIKDYRTYIFGDGVIIAWVFIDMLQFFSIGPDNNNYDLVNYILARYAAANMSQIVDFKGDVYWTSFYTAIGFCIVLIYCSVLILTNAVGRKCVFLTNLNDFALKLLVRILGNTPYLPIVALLLTIFECNDTISNDLTDSFLDGDCYSFCWRENHIIQAVISFVILSLYIPCHVCSYPYIQSIQLMSNIKIKFDYLLYRTLYQVLLVIIGKLLKPYHASIHGLLFTIILLSYLILLLKIKPFNYDRLNLWAFMCIAAVIWDSFISTVYHFQSYQNNLLWGGILAIGWILLGIYTVVYQRLKYPGYLYSEKNEEITQFFKFAFGRIRAVDINYLEKRRSKLYEIKEDKKEFLGIINENVVSFHYPAHTSKELII